MTRTDILLAMIGEEASEVAQEASKCLRFGPTEIYPPIGITNGHRVMCEYYDLKAIIKLLQKEGILPEISKPESELLMSAKVSKTEKMLEYSRECGRLS